MSTVPGLVLPAPYVARPADRADAPAIHALIAACEIAYDGAAEIDRADIEQSFDLTDAEGILVVEEARADAGVLVVEERSADPEDGAALEGSDTPKGRGLIAWATQADGRGEADVRPDRLGRGIGSALLDWTEARGRRAGDERVRQVVTDGNVAAHALFAARGYTQAYTSWILEMDLGEDPPDVRIPDGIALRPFREADAPAVYRVVETAFQEWRPPSSFERWDAHVFRHPAFSGELSRLAFDGAELVGVALATDYEESPEGWVGQLATKASHRHRGIARAVLHATAAAFHARGRRRIALSTDSRTGALTLYERLGMRTRRSYTSWTKDLA